MRAVGSLPLVVACLVAIPSRAAAQITVAPTPLLLPGTTPGPSRERLVVMVPLNWTVLEDLTTAYNAANWKRAQPLAADLLRDVSCRPDFAFQLPSTGPCPGTQQRRGFDLRSDYVMLVWVGPGAHGKPAVHRILVHDPEPEPYTARFPGLHDVGARAYEVFVSEQTAAAHAAAYAFTEVDDPLAAQLRDFVEGLQAPLLSLASTVLGAVRDEERRAEATETLDEQKDRLERAKREKPVAIWVRHLAVPLKRATVAVKDAVAIPFGGRDLAESATETTVRVRILEGGASQCAREYVNALGSQLATVGHTPACTEDATDPDCVEAIEDALNGATTPCVGPDDTTRAAIRATSAEFRKWLVGLKSTELVSEAIMENQPLRRYSFGALTSIALWAKVSAPRAKVADGILAADPLGRQLTMAVVNVSSKAYDARASKMSGAERVQAFVGAVILPNFGLSAGLTVNLARGIGVNGGYAVMGVPAARHEDEFGKAPTDAADPFRLGWAQSVFVGLSYSFGKK